MFKKHKKLTLALAAVGVVALPLSVNAASTTLQATATFLTAITLNATDMNFGNAELSGNAGSGDTIVMDTTGARTCNGNFSCTGNGTAGDVQITAGSDGNTVQVYCSANATLSDGTNTIQVNTITVNDELNGGVGTCDGLSGSGGSVQSSMVLNTSGSADQFKFGGTIDGGVVSGTVGAGTYNTSNSGGSAITVEVFYQ